MSVGTIVCVIWIASSIDTSTASATPVRDARRHAVAAPSAAYTPVTYSPRRPPTVSGGRPMWPWIDRLPRARLQHLVGRDEAVVGAAVPDRGDRHRHERVGAVGRAARLADDHDVGRREPRRGVGARAAATCAGT